MTKTDFLRGAAAFASQQPLFDSLCSVFLDDKGVHGKGSVSERMTTAMTLLSQEDGEIFQIVRALSEGQRPWLDSRRAAAGEGTPVESPKAPNEDASPVDTPAVTVEPTDAIEAASSESVTSTQGNPEPGEHKLAAHTIEAPPVSLPAGLLEWNHPKDDIESVQKALTRFERALVAFIQWRLETLHGPAWLSRGCGKLLNKMKNEMPPRWGRNRAKEPATALGMAHLKELGEVMTLKENWPAFRSYFDNDSGLVLRCIDSVTVLRVEGSHAGQRTIYVGEELEALSAMIRLTKTFHPDTAASIDSILQDRLGTTTALDDADSRGLPVHDLTMTNLGHDFEPIPLLGREQELQELEDFWADPTRRVVSIVGKIGGGGGVGKTALLETFLSKLLKSEVAVGQACSPEALIYLSAKDSYLSGVLKVVPKARRFLTIRAVFEKTLETIAGETQPKSSVDDLRSDIFALTTGVNANAVPVLFALDNLETLPEEELEELGEFLTNLPNGCKAIVTTRDDRRSGKRIALSGLSYPDSLELVRRTVAASGVELEIDADDPDAKELFKLTSGVPLHLKFCANLLVEGMPLNEAVSSLKGAQGIELLEFSFESSLKSLNEEAVTIAYYLALLKQSAKRSDMITVLRGAADLYTEVQNRLLQLSFIERTSEDKKQIRFQLTSPLLREHLLKRGPELLASEEVRRLRGLANAQPAAAESSHVTYEIDRALQTAARHSANRNWPEAIEILEAARKDWGDEGRLFAMLGYYHFRSERRVEAIKLFERAIGLGHESADTFAYLALARLLEGHPEEALRRAEQALEIRENHRLAEQIAGQALFGVAVANRFTFDERRRTDVLVKARTHLVRSVRPDLDSYGADVHNARTSAFLERVASELSTLGFKEAVPVTTEASV
jgi:tetratricopeptide (TPR) repeat protein